MTSVTCRDFLQLHLQTPLVSRDDQTMHRHFADMFIALSKVSPHLTGEDDDYILVDYGKLERVLTQTCWFDFDDAAQTVANVSAAMADEYKVYTVYYTPPGANQLELNVNLIPMASLYGPIFTHANLDLRFGELNFLAAIISLDSSTRRRFNPGLWDPIEPNALSNSIDGGPHDTHSLMQSSSSRVALETAHVKKVSASQDDLDDDGGEDVEDGRNYLSQHALFWSAYKTKELRFLGGVDVGNTSQVQVNRLSHSHKMRDEIKEYYDSYQGQQPLVVKRSL